MAKFKMTVLQMGNEIKGEEYTYTAAVEAVEFEEGDTELRFPEEYEGLPVTHIGYCQGYREGYMEYGDWHHPTHRADEYIPARYYPKNNPIVLPPQVERVFVSKCVCSVDVKADEENGHRPIYELDPENPTLALRPDGRLILKCFL